MINRAKAQRGPQGWNDQSQTRMRNDGIGAEFIPSTAHVFKGALRTINSLGMRDREYSVEKGPIRSALALSEPRTIWVLAWGTMKPTRTLSRIV